MEAKKYEDLVAFLSSTEEQRVWPSWINDRVWDKEKEDKEELPSGSGWNDTKGWFYRTER